MAARRGSARAERVEPRTVAELAAIELERRRRARLALPLLDFIPELEPRYVRPDHLAPVAELIERAHTEGNVFACVSLPPRHGKTELVLGASAWWLGRRPTDTLGYASYQSHFAQSKSKKARDYALRVGVQIREDLNTGAEWRTPEWGGMLATGVGGPFTGHGANAIFIDDPFKNRKQAESALQRRAVQEWFTSVPLTRLEPNASIIVVHTRWHEDDLIGWLTGREEIELPNGRRIRWEYVNLPALNDFDETGELLDPRRLPGEALWPDRWPADRLLERKARSTPYDWASLYQGRPRPRGGRMFEDPQRYTDLPNDPVRFGIGLDLAYTENTSSDHSVALLLARVGSTVYVHDRVKEQASLPVFGRKLKRLRAAYGNPPVFMYASGTERGGIDMAAAELGVPIRTRPATSDKFVRATPASIAWNRTDPGPGPRDLRIVVREGVEWDDDFLRVVKRFTGLGDAEDDDVDALAAGYDGLAETVGASKFLASAEEIEEHGRPWRDPERLFGDLGGLGY